MGKKIIYLAGIILIIVSFVAGFYFGDARGNERGLEEGKRVTEALFLSGILPSIQSAETNSLFGTITDIKDNSITLDASVITYAPGEERRIEAKTVIVTENTRFLRQLEGALEEWRRLEKEYLDAVEAGLNPDPPQPFEPEQISFTDLRIGDKVSAGATENIGGKEEFEASLIILIR